MTHPERNAEAALAACDSTLDASPLRDDATRPDAMPTEVDESVARGRATLVSGRWGVERVDEESGGGIAAEPAVARRPA
jgi:hypothetical protein